MRRGSAAAAVVRQRRHGGIAVAAAVRQRPGGGGNRAAALRQRCGHRLVPREQRPHMMEARVRHAVEQGPAPPVDADVPFRHAVDAKQAFDACQ